MQEEFHESIKSDVEGELGTLRMGRKSSIIHEDAADTPQKSQSLIDIESNLKESGGAESPIKEDPEGEIKTHVDN